MSKSNGSMLGKEPWRCNETVQVSVERKKAAYEKFASGITTKEGEK